MGLQYKKISTFENKPVEYILKNYLPFPKGTLGMMSSKGGVGKTFCSVILATKFVNESKKEGTNLKAACWFSEDDGVTIKNRALSLKHAEIIEDLTDIDNVIQITEEPKHILKTNFKGIEIDYDALNDIIDLILYEQIGLLIIDPLIAFFGGDENNNPQAKAFMQCFVNICERLNINIIFLHHANKGENATRGAGAFVDALRTLYEIDFPKTKIDREIVVDKKKYNEGVRNIILKKDNRNVSYLFNKINKNKFNENTADYKILPVGVKKIDLEKYYKECEIFGVNDKYNCIDNSMVKVSNKNKIYFETDTNKYNNSNEKIKSNKVINNNFKKHYNKSDFFGIDDDDIGF